MSENILGIAKALESTLESVESRISSRIPALVESAIAQAMESVRSVPREVHVHVPGAPVVNVGRQHANFDQLVTCVFAGVHVYLVGPAGSGKTMGAEKSAEGLGLAFSAMSVGPQTTQAHIFGYMDATGTYRGTQVRERFEHGGVLLIDEIDRGNAGVLTSLNALLANDVCAFPDGMVHRHPDFRVIAAANTVGQGADRQYVGALQLDAATLDRFAMLEWNYDEAFEADLAASYGQTGLDWCARVQAYRKAVSDLKIRHIVSPRATLNGAKLIQAGMSLETVETMVLWSGLDANSVSRVKAHASLPDPKPTPKPTPEVHEDPEEIEAPAAHSGKACPACGKTSSVMVSRWDDSQLVCSRRRGGCNKKWSA